MVRAIQPSRAVLAARARRPAVAAKRAARIEWFIREVNDKVAFTLKTRMRIATDLLRSKVVHNLSKPVGKGKSTKTGRVVVTKRSKPGEFPRAETTLLMSTIFSQVIRAGPAIYDGFVGTPLDYGLILETSKRLNRSFLVRTFRKELPTMTRILTGPIK